MATDQPPLIQLLICDQDRFKSNWVQTNLVKLSNARRDDKVIKKKTTGAEDKFFKQEPFEKSFHFGCESVCCLTKIYTINTLVAKNHDCFALLVDFLVVVVDVDFLAPPPALPPREF